MKMTNKNIDKQIYRLSPHIRRHYLPLYGGYICTLVGVLAATLYFSIGNISGRQALSEFIIALIALGIIAFLIVVFYYLVGDCCRPYYRPDHSLIERTEGYYDNSQRSAIVTMVKNGDADALQELPKSVQAQLIAVCYRDAGGHITAMQAFENDEGRLTPITDICFVEKNSEA